MAIPEMVIWYMLTFVGFTNTEAHKMTCIAKYESGLRPTAVNLHNDNGSIDVGLFQINTVWFKTIPYCRLENLDNPISNAKCARYIYRIQGIEAWVAWNKYKNICSTYQVDLRNGL